MHPEKAQSRQYVRCVPPALTAEPEWAVPREIDGRLPQAVCPEGPGIGKTRVPQGCHQNRLLAASIDLRSPSGDSRHLARRPGLRYEAVENLSRAFGWTADASA